MSEVHGLQICLLPRQRLLQSPNGEVQVVGFLCLRSAGACIVEELESADEESGGWKEWQAGGAEEGEDGDAAQCLFGSDAMPSPEAVFQHCLEVHSFELLQVRVDAELGFYDTLRLTNLIRSQVFASFPSS